MADYTVVFEHDIADLIQKVRDLLGQGYEPLDGVQVVAPVLNGDDVAPLFVQTLTRK